MDTWTVRENLQSASSGKLSDQEIRCLLTQVGLDEVEPNDRAATLSGGQQKRVSLLGAWLRGTRLLILNEPTSGLDPISIDRVKQLAKPPGDSATPRAILVVTHYFPFALAICDRILFVTGSRLEDVTPSPALSAEERERELRRRFEEASGAVWPGSRRVWAIPEGWVAALGDFLGWGVLITVPTMLVLGVLMAAHAASIDIPLAKEYADEIAKGFSIGILREIAPPVVGLLLAARIAARVSAQIGGMKYTAQLDSLRLLGESPARRFLLAFTPAALVTFRFCIVLGAAVAIGAAGLAIPARIVPFSLEIERFFYLAAEASSGVLILSCVVKGVLMGLVVTVMSFCVAQRDVSSASKLGLRVTLAAVGAAVCVVLVDVAVSAVFF